MATDIAKALVYNRGADCKELNDNNDGYQPHEIGVFVRAGDQLKRVAQP